MNPQPIRVVGVGSPHGDDAVGWQVVRCMRRQCTGVTGAEFMEVDGGQRLLDVLDGQGTLILVDAIADGAAPGNVQRLEWPDTRIEVLAPGSTHALRPAQALQLAAVLGQLPPRVVIYGISTTAMEPASGLNPAVAAAVEVAALRIEGELAALTHAFAMQGDDHA